MAKPLGQLAEAAKDPEMQARIRRHLAVVGTADWGRAATEAVRAKLRQVRRATLRVNHIPRRVKHCQ